MTPEEALKNLADQIDEIRAYTLTGPPEDFETVQEALASVVDALAAIYDVLHDHDRELGEVGEAVEDVEIVVASLLPRPVILGELGEAVEDVEEDVDD